MPLQSAQVQSFRATVAQRLGLRFDDSKLNELEKVLRLRVRETKSRDVADYLLRLGTSREELRVVVTHLTVPETYFFRIPEHFEALKEIVLANRVRARGNSRRLNILSAGCASGEEAYSIAMVLAEHAELAGWDISIRGIDINPEVIAKGKAARYSAWSLRGITPEIKRKFLQPHRREFRVEERIRKMVSLEEGNLADSSADFWRQKAYDIAFFRNVLMYFCPEAARAIMDRMARSIAPDGYLFLGPAETLRGVSQEFHLCHTHGTFYYQRRATGVPHKPAAVPVSQELYAGLATKNIRDAAAGAAEESSATKARPGAEFAAGGVSEIEIDWVTAIRKASERIETLTRNSHSGLHLARRVHETAMPEKTAPTDVSTALDLFRKERFAEALEALPAGQTHADTDVQLLRAVLLANSGDLVQAESVCAELLDADELNAGAHYVMALCREHAGEGHAAVEHNRIAIYLDPSFAMPHLHLGLLCKRAGDMNTACQELNQASLLLEGESEDSSRVLLFGGGFSRQALVALCRRELQNCAPRQA